ncbi:Cytochrome P450 [Amycolatopsis arida]|uniref:Cytochrome P450 n=1 Tax=Amycolatopsis arida TaxID=587909 RepID=A0A1I5ZI67_9PSEU|nr:cytochrome P450 [Amycolatopsis arida]TDX89700.1 cytochrome P450 [Amycolatopsis arida]SFQ56125.1 Cytochrome P450 [Amycolatopsis arida]
MTLSDVRPTSLTPPGPRLPLTVQSVLFAFHRHWWLPALRRRYGDVVRLRIYPEREVVILADPAHIRTVFAGPTTVYHAGEGNMVLKPVMGEHSLLITDEDEHLRARKLLMPAFSGAALRGYRDMVERLTEAEVARWPVGRPFPSHHSMHALTLEVILRVVFGMADGGRLDELRTLLRQVVDIGPFDIVGWHSATLQRFGRWRRNEERMRRVDELLYAEIAERRRTAERGDLAERGDVLSRLLRVPGESESSAGLSDAELRDQLVTLLLAGHETTATALAWAFHDLARDPDRQARAARAADEGGDRADTYLEAVAKESLRRRPVIAEVARRLTEDVEIAGFRIPAGTTVAPSIALVHADPAHHTDPDDFRPERFLGDGPATGTWLPFGGGVRRCLGAGFSLLEATVVLRAVLARFRLAADRPRPEPTKGRHITLVPGGGARIVAYSRVSDSP